MPKQSEQKRQYQRKYYQQRKAHYRILNREWRKTNPDRARFLWRRSVARNRNKINERQRFKRHGITLDEYNKILESQNSLCAICYDSLVSNRKHLDHCHNSNKIRGILCSKCNHGLGLFRDNPQLLANAIYYLSKHSSVETQYASLD